MSLFGQYMYLYPQKILKYVKIFFNLYSETANETELGLREQNIPFGFTIVKI